MRRFGRRLWLVLVPIALVALGLVGNLATGFVKVSKSHQPWVLAAAAVLVLIAVAAGIRDAFRADRDRRAPAMPGKADMFAGVRAKYLARVCARYQRVGLEILAPLTERGEHPAMLLGTVFVPQNVRENPPPQELLDLPREVMRRLLEDGQISKLPEGVDRARLEAARRAYRDRPSLPVLEALRQTHKAVVLGDPGAGKSTLGRYAVLGLALAQTRPETHPVRNALPTVWNGRLPLLIELRSYADARWRGRTFLDLVDELWRTQDLGLPKEQLAEFLRGGGQALVVFDGLDEIFDAKVRADVTRQIEGFAARYPGVHTIVTSRVIGYQDNRAVLDAAGFTTYMLQDLDRGQIAGFAKTWYDHSCPGDPQEATRLRGRLLGAIDRSPAVAELAGNPMLLTILAIMARRSELPRDRSTVYKQAVTVLIEDWDVNKHLREQNGGVAEVTELDATDKLEMLHRVARRMQDASAGLAGNHLPGEVLTQEFEKHLTDRLALSRERAVPASRAMLRQFQHRNFILSSFGANMYGFVHRAFLEYLAADDIRQRFSDRKLSEDDLLDLFDTHAADSAWSEVLLLLIGMIPEQFAVQAILRLITTDPHWAVREALPAARLLAVRALGDIRRRTALTPHAPTITGAIIQLLSIAASGERSLYTALGIALHEALPASPQCPEWLDIHHYRAWYRTSRRPFLNEFIFITAEDAARLFVLTYSDDRVALRDRATNDDRADVREAAVQAIAQGWPEDPNTLALLRDRAANDDHSAVRRAAVQAIVQGWPGDPDVLALLRDRATNDTDEDVREAAVKAIVQGWPGDPNALTWLRDRAANDDHSAVRRAAVQAIVQGWPEDPNTLALLRDRVTNDNWAVRRAAVQVIAQGWPGDLDVLTLLCDRATNDDKWAVRDAAVRAIAQGWPGEPNALTLLRDRAANDAAEDVRVAAVLAIGQGGPGDPNALVWLREWAANDDKWAVRVATVKAIAQGWPEDPDTFTWLRDRAANDADEDVRAVAVQAIVQGWPEDPGTLAWLRDRTTNDDWAVRQAAVQAIARGWPEDPNTLSLLRDRAANDDHGAVRQAAVRAIARGWPGDPDFLTLLRDRVTNGADEDVRQTAVYMIAQGWPEDPNTLTFLRDRATNDGHRDVRRNALYAIAQEWPGDPNILTWLRDRSANDADEDVRQAAVRAIAQGWYDDLDADGPP